MGSTLSYSVSATPTELDILCYIEYLIEYDINDVFCPHNKQPNVLHTSA